MLLQYITGQLHIEMTSVQKQNGSTDCGLFAIANAFEVASGNKCSFTSQQ